jgi:hypothetical protein
MCQSSALPTRERLTGLFISAADMNPVAIARRRGWILRQLLTA